MKEDTTSGTNEDFLVDMKNITKTFGAVKALENINFHVKEDEIVGLLGDNGAGKSTLIKILCGVLQPDKGEIYFKNEKLEISSPAEAREKGIETVHQDLSLVNTLSIDRNMFLGKEPTKKIGPLKFLDKQEMKQESSKVIGEVGIKVRDPDEFVAILSGGERQAISIGRSVYFDADLLILDEPLRALSVKEQNNVLEHVKEVQRGGTAVIFISHNVYHANEVTDRFVILNNGKKQGEILKGDCDPEVISEYVSTGEEVDEVLDCSLR